MLDTLFRMKPEDPFMVRDQQFSRLAFNIYD